MPFDERLGGAFQRRHVEVAADLAGIGDRVGGAAGCEVHAGTTGTAARTTADARGRDLRLFPEEAG